MLTDPELIYVEHKKFIFSYQESRTFDQPGETKVGERNLKFVNYTGVVVGLGWVHWLMVSVPYLDGLDL